MEDLLPTGEAERASAELEEFEKEWAASKTAITKWAQILSSRKSKPWREVKENYNLATEYSQTYEGMTTQYEKYKLGKPDPENIPKTVYWIGTWDSAHPQPPQSLSSVYKLLREYTSNKLVGLKSSWQDSLGILISNQYLEEIWRMGRVTVRSCRFRSFAWRCLHKYFYTPYWLARMFLQQDSHCWRCTEAMTGDWTHIFWECRMLDPLKQELATVVKEISRGKVPLNETLYFLGIQEQTPLGNPTRELIWIAMLVGEKTITRK